MSSGNVAFGLKQDRLPKPEIQSVSRHAGTGKMSDYANRMPHSYPAGNATGRAGAFAGQAAKLLLLDEPLGALDKKLREHTQFELISLQESSA